MNASQDLLARRARVVPDGVAQFTGTVTAVSASGARITDADGREFIDFAGGIGVMNVGHGQPEVIRAIQEQAEKLVHTCIHIATYEPYVALCEKLVELFPHGTGDDHDTRAMLVNSGAEAVENAIKIARQATGRPAVLCYSEGFHGRTLLCATLTSKVGYKIGCGPFAPEVYRLPYPNHRRNGAGLDEETFAERELDRLRGSFASMVRAEDVAAIIIEAVQGEGGFVAAPHAYLRGLRRICDEHGIVLILDEVQSGFCRTGRWAAYEHAGVFPDLSTWAKSMAGGMPLSTVIGRGAIINAARPGTIGGTYGGNPVACAAALATIHIMERDDLNARADHVGARVHESFRRIATSCPHVADVRGVGAMQAIEFGEDGDIARPAGDLARAIRVACLERGLLLITAGTHGNVIRVLSPLTISDADLDEGLRILEEEAARLTGSAGSTAVPVVAETAR